MAAIEGSFPHDLETIGDRDPIVLLLLSARIAITVDILWCYVYDARPITNGSLLRRLANRRTSVGQDYETSDRRTRQLSHMLFYGAMFTMHTSSETFQGCESCMIRQLTQTFSFPASFVILSDIAHALQMTTVCMLAHVSSL